MTTPHIVDSHCHLDFPDFDEERSDVIDRAVAETYDPVFYAAGTHPMSVAQEPLVSAQDLIDLAAHPKFVGIGESGLDYHYTAESADIQKTSLRVHIEAAQETGLPLIIHNRASDDDMIEILSQGMAQKPFSCVMHCFSSSEKLGMAAIEMGLYLSMSGISAFPKSSELRDIFAKAPVERILVETDSPYLAPPPHRGKRNEPAYTTHTAQVGADIFGLSYADFAAQTTANFDRLFSKAAAWKAEAAA